MRVRAFDGVGDKSPVVKQASVVLTEDNRGTIISAAVTLGVGPEGREMIHVVHADDPDFNKVLQQLGIDRVTICDSFHQTNIKKLMV